MESKKAKKRRLRKRRLRKLLSVETLGAAVSAITTYYLLKRLLNPVKGKKGNVIYLKNRRK